MVDFKQDPRFKNRRLFKRWGRHESQQVNCMLYILHIWAKWASPLASSLYFSFDISIKGPIRKKKRERCNLFGSEEEVTKKARKLHYTMDLTCMKSPTSIISPFSSFFFFSKNCYPKNSLSSN